ncbi:MAG: dihydroneopterin aldolase [Actinomycetota bacterium]
MRYDIELKGLEVYAYHGVLQHEQDFGQTFLIDCLYQVEADAEDQLTATVSYAAVADLLHVTATSNRFDLIESLASACLAAVSNLDSKIAAVKITVHKPQAPIEHKFADVSVSVQSGRFEN